MVKATFHCYAYNSYLANLCVIINGTFAALVVWFIYVKDIKLYNSSKSNKTIVQVKEPGLLTAYFKATHDKICPLLEWEY